MKLYSDDTSPYCAPVRAAIYAKGLDIPMEPPPGGLKSEAYTRACVTIGRDVRAELPGDRTVTGRASGVDGAGALLVTTVEQGVLPIGAGDVVHLRPAAGN